MTAQLRKKVPLLLLPLLLLSGCGTKYPVVEVTGTIKFTDGKPLPAGTRLRFDPLEGDRESASATVSTDGSFAVEHVSGTTGAETGNYMIAVLPPEGQEKEFAEVVPGDYIDGGILSIEVKEGMKPLAFTVKKKKAKKRS